MSVISQDMKQPLLQTQSGNWLTKNLNKFGINSAKTRLMLQETAQMANMVTGGKLSTLVSTPRWEAKLKKAGLGMMYPEISDLSKVPEFLMFFQYNPETLNERRSVTYDFRGTFQGDKPVTIFKRVDEGEFNIEFILDAFYDYNGLADYYRSILSGGVQSALLLANTGSTGFSEASYIAKSLTSFGKAETSYVNKDTRSLVGAINNLKLYTQCPYVTYKISNVGTEQESSSIESVTTSPTEDMFKDTETSITRASIPPICRLTWGEYVDTPCVVTSLEFTHLLFNPGNLHPIRTKVAMELKEHFDPFSKLSLIKDGDFLDSWREQ